MRSLTALTLAVLALCGAPAFAQTEAASPPATSTPIPVAAAEAAAPVICRTTERGTSTRMTAKKECHTQAEWDAKGK
jgi:hypothetical protein